MVGESGQKFFIKMHQSDFLRDQKYKSSEDRDREHGLANRLDGLPQGHGYKYYNGNIARLNNNIP